MTDLNKVPGFAAGGKLDIEATLSLYSNHEKLS